MKKIIYIAFVLLIISCKKDYEYIDIEPKECEKENIYYLTINNNTSSSYEITGNGDFYAWVEPNKSIQEKVSTTINSFRISYSGIGDEHSYTEKVYGNRCGEYTINIGGSNTPECIRKRIFYVTIKNNKSNTYYVYDNDGNKLSSVEPNKTCTIELSATGIFYSHKLKLEQANGYIFFPTIYNKEVSGNSCDEKNISIP